MILENQKELFDISSDTTFLNCANMSPLLKSVSMAGNNAIKKRSHPWKIGIGDWFEPAEELRYLFAKIINADRENIALITSVSYGIAVAANNISLNSSQTIIILDQQFPSNVYSWRELAKKTGAKIITIIRDPGQNWTDAIISKINTNTGLVAIPNCHWSDGSFIDLEKISKEVKKVEAKLIIDASQSLGAYPLDIEKIKPDFLVTVGYKWLLGPYGLGYLYADQKYCDTGNPIEFSWLNKMGSENFSKLDYTDEYKPGARRFDAGGFPGFIHIPMAIAALTQIIKWGVENIQTTLSELTNEIEHKANYLKLETPKKNSRVGHMTGIKFPENQVSVLSKRLTENNVFTSFRGLSMRISPHLYNDKEDIQKLFSLLQT